MRPHELVVVQLPQDNGQQVDHVPIPEQRRVDRHVGVIEEHVRIDRHTHRPGVIRQELAQLPERGHGRLDLVDGLVDAGWHGGVPGAYKPALQQAEGPVEALGDLRRRVREQQPEQRFPFPYAPKEFHPSRLEFGAAGYPAPLRCTEVHHAAGPAVRVDVPDLRVREDLQEIRFDQVQI